MPQHPIRVMLVDDHEMTRHLLRELIGKVAGLAVLAEAAGGESAVETKRHTGPDVLEDNDEHNILFLNSEET